ncbi:MAG: DUF6434 domain-containing protein [Actinomycetota bacterium]
MATDRGHDARPAPSAALSEHEFRRWYWTLEELKTLARALGVATSGRKADVTERIAAALAGRRQPSTTRATTEDVIGSTLSAATAIPPKQRATQELRRWFQAEIGPSFRFDGHMRAFLADGGGTLGDAVDHWHATRGVELPTQSDSLEFNRFTKAWHRAHPSGSADEARAAWARYRALPTDQRPPVADA